MSDWSAVAVRYDRAVREMRAAQQRKCEAVWEFLRARDALRETLDTAAGEARAGVNNPGMPNVHSSSETRHTSER